MWILEEEDENFNPRLINEVLKPTGVPLLGLL
jgi:hypothetical protein